MGRKNPIIKPDINYEQLADSIAKAITKVKEKEIKEAEKKKEEELKEWHETIGLKEYPTNEKWVKRVYHKFLNNLKCFKAFIFYKKEYVKTPVMSFEFMRMIISGFYGLLQIALLFIGMILIIGAFISRDNMIGNIITGIFILFFSAFFRIARLEIECTDNKEMLNMIFSALISFVSIVISIAALAVAIKSQHL
ncbi:MAG: hypothetical protein NC485_00050 [Ruminococcus flavefaciens]|nr:hypothetical protein [Ruminococcus flavefaciens]